MITQNNLEQQQTIRTTILEIVQQNNESRNATHVEFDRRTAR